MQQKTPILLKKIMFFLKKRLQIKLILLTLILNIKNRQKYLDFL